MLTSCKVRIDRMPRDSREQCAAAVAPARAVDLSWLGQAGFLVQTASQSILIDPYLSDSLAKKYRGREFPHERLMPSPIALHEIGGIAPVDAVLCTHRHSDHMDPETLAAIAASHPRCSFVVPAAEADRAVAVGLSAERLLPIDAMLSAMHHQDINPQPKKHKTSCKVVIRS